MTSIQTPIGGWHREPTLGTEVRVARAMAEAPTMDTKELPVMPEAIRPVVLAQNPKPDLLKADWDNTFWVLAPGGARGRTSIPRWIEFNKGLDVLCFLMMVTVVLSPIAFFIWTTVDFKTEKEVLRQIGWKETGPCTVFVGLYEWKNGKATRLGMNHPGDGR